jgi:4-amino-4-deoxy-L-arabinose transferase-like glycosyltransferase
MKNKIVLIAILVLAVFLRFINLGTLPNSYSPDELAQGYTAYSLLTTGKDEWGSSNWLNLRSFGDYKPPLQTLLMLPSIKVFGLTPFAVRFPNAFLSIFTILLTYLIANEIFKNKKIGLLSALFMAVSPWSLPMSRIALEANVVVFIVALAVFLFLKSIKNKNYFLFTLSILLFGVSLFTYHSAKVFTPLLLVILFFYQKLYRHKVFAWILILVFSLSFLFNYQITSQIKSSRTNDIAIFNPTEGWHIVSDNQYEMTQTGLPYPIVKIFYNKVVYLSEIFFQNYLSYFSPQFLITQGAGETTYGMLCGFGVLGLIPTLGLITLLFLIIKNKYPEFKKSFIFLILVISIPPMVAALAKGQYSANRVSLMMPFIQILSAAGIVLFIEKLPKITKRITIILVSIVFCFTSFMFLQRYYFQGNQLLAGGMLYGRQQTIDFVKDNPQINQVIFSRKLSEPQAYVAFFDKIDPKITQSESKKWLEYETKGLPFLDKLGEYKLGKYTFRELNISGDKKMKNTILIGRPDEFLDTKPDYIIYEPSIIKPPEVIYIFDTSLHEN